MNNYHISVLLQQTIDLLHVEPGKLYIDATLGGAGHTTEILRRGGKVLAIDFDQDAIEYAQNKLSGEKKLVLAQGNFKDIDIIAKEHGFEKVAGILFDLGISSHHVDTAERGFSFQKEGPLDMRMDRDLKVKAGDLINVLTKGELYELFHKLGEERFAKTIAHSIVSTRKIKPIQTTTELAEIIRRAVPGSYKTKVNPATKAFQALRIATNDELNNIREALPKAMDLLEEKGRLAVISFHSLEDRIVKHKFKEWFDAEKGKILTKKPIEPSLEEVESNKRSRSSKLRVIEKI